MSREVGIDFTPLDLATPHYEAKAHDESAVFLSGSISPGEPPPKRTLPPPHLGGGEVEPLLAGKRVQLTPTSSPGA